MDSVNCYWSGASGKQSIPKPRPIANTLSRLAVLMAHVEHRQEGHSPKSQQSCFSICKDCGQEFSDLSSLSCHQQSEHVLQKPHRCQHCGQEFALGSTLQLHRCLTNHLVCKVCRGRPQRGSSCHSCLAEALGPQYLKEQSHHLNHRLHHDSSPYACAPCGKAFSHKQELLCHQQDGGCQPAPLSPKAFMTSSALLALSPDDAPTPSYASLPPSPSETKDYPFTCRHCLKTFRTVQGLASHQRLVHTNSKTKKKKTSKLNQKLKGSLFPCRSCDRVFSQTSMLYLHRKEEHRRKTSRMRQQRSYAKCTRQRQKGETYPCLQCGKVFLHHLTRWAHFKSYGTHYQTHLSKSGKLGKMDRADRTANDLKTARDLKLKHASKPLKESKIFKTNKKVKKQHLPLKTRKHEIADKEATVIQNEDGEFPCTSCEKVFKTQSSLQKHEEVHQSSYTPNHCSVCNAGIALPAVVKSSVNRIYHCVPCKEIFVDLATFLQHCTTHHFGNEDESDGDRLCDE
ncbi:hypothetical protein AOLI_G00157960 [Acnodon oligacanthus]